jgi:hypothetical protein
LKRFATLGFSTCCETSLLSYTKIKASKNWPRRPPASIVPKSLPIYDIHTGFSLVALQPSSKLHRSRVAQQCLRHAVPAARGVRRRAVQFLGRMKYSACLQAAIVAYPYIRLRDFKGTYLYFLARLLQ